MYALKALFRFIFVLFIFLLHAPALIYFFVAYKYNNIFSDSVYNSEKAAQNILKLLQRLGPAYVKLGQFLATRPDVVGGKFAEILTQLQDRMKPYPKEKAEKILKDELKKRSELLINNLSEPIAAASIAQVHKSVILDKNNQKIYVAVKILRPNIKKKFLLDLYIFKIIAKIIEILLPSKRRLKPVEVVNTLTKSVRIEMDLRFEAAAIQEMQECINKNQKSKPKFQVPDIFWQYVTKSILVTSWIDGKKFTDMQAICKSSHDCHELAVNLMQGFLENVIEHGFFHADMHQGNIFVDKKGNLILIDFGIVGRLSKIWRRLYAEIIYSFIKGDYMRGARVHFEAGYVPYGQDPYIFAQALRSIGAPIYGLPSKEISIATLLMQLLEITDLFDMPTQEKLLLLQKNMVTVEGICRQLDPGIDIWQVSKPIIEKAMKEKLAPITFAQSIQEELTWRYLPLLHKLPDYLNRNILAEKTKTNNVSNTVLFILIGIIIGFMIGK